MNTDSTQKSRLWVALPTAIIVGVANIFVFFVFMVLYGHVINPGLEESHYQEFANRYGPYSHIIAGIPIMFVTGLILRRYLGARALKVAILAWAIYVAIYLMILIAAGEIMNVLPFFVVSFATKLAATYLGARTPAVERKE